MKWIIIYILDIRNLRPVDWNPYLSNSELYLRKDEWESVCEIKRNAPKRWGKQLRRYIHMISACCSYCRDRSLWGRIFYDFVPRFMKFPVQCRLHGKLMSCRRFCYYKIRGLMFWLIVIKCKWPASFQYLIFHFILSFLKNSNLLIVIYITFWFNRLNRFNVIKELLEIARQYLKKKYTLLN